jgi:hypothetical protein
MVFIQEGVEDFAKLYMIQEPALEARVWNPTVFEQRAYRVTNRLITCMMEDPEFWKGL